MRNFQMPARQRLARHLRANGQRALLGGISTTAVLAGFVDASGRQWALLRYIVIAAGCTGLLLVAFSGDVRRPHAAFLRRRWRDVDGAPRQLELLTADSTPRPGGLVLRCHDPVYGGGMRALLEPSRPVVIIPSSRRDVGRVHELPLRMFVEQEQGQRTRVDVDPGEFDIPLDAYSFERELPDGNQDDDHTLAVKDLVYVPELAAALRGPGGDGGLDPPMMWPEHCVDPAMLAARDVVVVGGPDTNFWHGALFEPVVREFATPASRTPLAMDLRDDQNGFPVYGSRSISVCLAGLPRVMNLRENRAELDERLFPTYGMVLACRNPFAAAVGRSHWCVFVAGTRSLGTSGAVLGLAMMLRAMRADGSVNFFSAVPTDIPGASAPVAAVLCRTVEVERSVLRRGGGLTPRSRYRLPTEGRDPGYSDSYVPTEVEYLSYDGDRPRWHLLGRIGES